MNTQRHLSPIRRKKNPMPPTCKEEEEEAPFHSRYLFQKALLDIGDAFGGDDFSVVVKEKRIGIYQPAAAYFLGPSPDSTTQNIPPPFSYFFLGGKSL